jgi:hypothetical protein
MRERVFQVILARPDNRSASDLTAHFSSTVFSPSLAFKAR